MSQIVVFKRFREHVRVVAIDVRLALFLAQHVKGLRTDLACMEHRVTSTSLRRTHT